ncbi:hypothetical protein TNCV_3019241 [Trichonephila clavipes]|nr:hypothetical protein TNCV_3019241 [Trichonephila clavipes]
MLQKRLFYCRNCEIRLRSIFLRQGYLRMSQQRDLPESMAWRVIGRLESGQTQRLVSRTLLKSPEVLSQGCGLDSKKQEMLDVDQGQVGHAPLHKLMTGIYS